MVERVLEELSRELAWLHPASPKLPILSTLTADNTPRFDAPYWAAQMRGAVRVARYVSSAPKQSSASNHPPTVNIAGFTFR